MNDSKKKVVVLGAAGYIGSTLVDLLLNNDYKVLAVDNFWKGNCDTLIPFITNPNFSFSFGDITNPEDMKKLLNDADFIWAGAALVGFPCCKRYPDLAQRTNVYGLENVLKYRRKNCPTIFMSTGSVYGEVPSGLCSEESDTNPLSLYGITKLDGEKISLKEGNVIIFRPATAFGVGYASTRVNLLANTLCYEAVINKTIILYESSFRRTFVHVRDICTAILHSIKNFNEMYSNHKIYNLGHKDLNITKGELVEKIRQKTGCKVINMTDTFDDDKRNYACDFSRLYSTNWTPTVDLDTGLDELIKISPMLTEWNRYN